MGWFNSIIVAFVTTMATVALCNGLSPRVENESSKYELHVFGAEWCPPCRKMNREVWQSLVDPKKYKDEQHKSMGLFLEENSVKFYKHMWKKGDDTFKKYNIKLVPAILLVDGEDVILFTQGYKTKEQVKKLINTKIKG